MRIQIEIHAGIGTCIGIFFKSHVRDKYYSTLFRHYPIHRGGVIGKVKLNFAKLESGLTKNLRHKSSL